MKSRQELVKGLLVEKLENTKVGIIINGVDGISPVDIAKEIGDDSSKKIYAVVVGESEVNDEEGTYFSISTKIEQAVVWRNNSECAGNILVFIKGDVDKMHSLNVFDRVHKKDVTQYAIDLQRRAVTRENRPIREFWDALYSTADFYSLQNIEEFISEVEKIADKTAAIAKNLWRLELLCDDEILSAKVDREQRLVDNKNRIIDIAQISENGRKNLSKSLSRATASNKSELQKAYKLVEEYSQYGEKSTLKDLDFSIAGSLLSAAKPKKKKTPAATPPPTPDPATNGGGTTDEEKKTKTLKKSDVDDIVTEQILFGDESGLQDIVDLYDELKDGYADETTSKITIDTSDGIFDDNTIELDNPHDSLREIVGTLCSPNAWGGKLEVKETEIKDAIASSAVPKVFSPTILKLESMDVSLYDILEQFDDTYDFEESFKATFDTIIEAREKLCDYIDFLMYNPFILLESNPDAKDALYTYVEAWGKLYSLYNAHNKEMESGGSTDPAKFMGRGLLALDILYIHTGDDKWKAVLMPLHPLYLWNYYEICKTLLDNKGSMTKSELTDLKSVLVDPPQLLNYLAVDKGICGRSEDIILPCSGNIQMLPTFENSTNRFLGDDGLEKVTDILERWIGFAPFSKNEIRICTVDAPNLAKIIRQISSFIKKNNIEKLIYDVYYTRGQNGNAELASLEYSDKDYDIGEQIKTGQLVLCVHGLKDAGEVQMKMAQKPVHIAYFFDQSKYSVDKNRPNEGKLYSNPFVITYDFSYDRMTKKGTISPSSRSQTGIVGDYHNVMVSAAYLSENKSPWISVDPSEKMDDMLFSVKNNEAQWLVIADRDIGSYRIEDKHELIPVGEQLTGRRRVGIWTSSQSRIISQYQRDLMDNNLSPTTDDLVNMIKSFGHIATAGLISIPKAGFDSKATSYRQKGLLGTLFAATWYSKREQSDTDNVLIASLDTDKAKVWLTAKDEEKEDNDKKLGQVRADLVGLKYSKESDTLYVNAIEVKTRDEDNESQRDYELYTDEFGEYRLRGHAPDQVAATVRILQSIFETSGSTSDNFVAARREVLKYQIITECFRNIHDKQWQIEWHSVLSRAFEKEDRDGLKIVVSGMLVYIRLADSSTKDSIPVDCKYDGDGDYPIELSVLTSHDIQKQVFEEQGSDTATTTGNEGLENAAADVTDTGSNDDIPTDDSNGVERGESEIASAEDVDGVQATEADEQKEEHAPDEAVGSGNYDDVEAEIEKDIANDEVDSAEGEAFTKKPLSDVRMLLGEDQRSGEQFFWEFGNKKLNNRHLLINGNSGSGKTYCIEALLMEAALQGISAVVFDYTGGFTTKKLDPVFKEKLGDRIQQRLVRMNKIPINPFERHDIEIDEDVFVPETDVDIASKIAETFASVYSMGDQQKSTVYTAVLTGLEKYGDKMNFKHMADEMEEIGTSYAKTALSRIQQFVDIDPFVTGEDFDWSDIRDSEGVIYIFQFMSYGRDIQVMLTELLLWDLWSFSIKNGSEDKPFIYVIDEAQNLSHSEKSPSGLILTEGRKHGLSGWYATQFMKPQLNDDEIQRLQQADQKLYFCPPGDGVITVAKNIDITTQGTKDWAERLQKLSKGECVTCGSMVRGGKWNKYDPRVIKISSLDERL